MRRLLWMILAILSATVMLACAEEDEAGEGTLTLTLWGEEFIEEGIPAEEMADDYEVTFTKFLIALSGISAAAGIQLRR